MSIAINVNNNKNHKTTNTMLSQAKWWGAVHIYNSCNGQIKNSNISARMACELYIHHTTQKKVITQETYNIIVFLD